MTPHDAEREVLPRDLAAPSEATSPSAEPPGGFEHWLRHAGLFLSGQTISMFGSSLVQYAILWHLTLTTKSGLVLMGATLFGFLPQAIVSVFGGVWADRHDRKLIVIGADGTIALTTLVLATLLVRGVDDLWLVYVVLAIRSVGAGFQQPAVAALLPQIVPTDRLMRVNGISTSLQSGSALLAPAIAAWLYASFELGSILFVDVATAAIGIGFLLLIPVARIVREGAAVGYLDDLRGGLRYVRGHPVVRRVLLFFALVFFLIVPPSNLTPLMVVRSFGGDVWKLTALEVAFSVGMILGGVVLAWWGGLENRITLLAISSITFGLLTVGIGLSSTLWVFLVIMVLCGICLPFFWTTSQTLLQETVEPEMQGRVFGLLGIVMALAMPFGMMVFGPLSDVVPIETLLIVAGTLTAAAGVVVMTRFSTVSDAEGPAASVGAPPATR